LEEKVVDMSTATLSSESSAKRVEYGTVAVVAHSGKTLGGGLRELRDELLSAGIADPLWFEVPKSKRAPKCVRRALESGADLLLVWGGDGMVQRCIDAAAGSDVALAVIPAGTANLFASNLGIPKDLRGAVDLALHGRRRRFDLGRVNGEYFAVMAGAGMDALMIRDADGALKRRLGRAAYIVSGARSIATGRVPTRVKVDGAKWFAGKASCVLAGNVGKVIGNVTVFPDASPTDGLLEIGVVTAKGRWQWTRTLARAAAGQAPASPFVETARGRRIDVRFSRPVPYELDGGDRKKTKRLRIAVHAEAIAICVPAVDV
jgi:YegS/Rv2252/BmrU family lipid kinase